MKKGPRRGAPRAPTTRSRRPAPRPRRAGRPPRAARRSAPGTVCSESSAAATRATLRCVASSPSQIAARTASALSNAAERVVEEVRDRVAVVRRRLVGRRREGQRAQLLAREGHARALARARVLGRLERGPPSASAPATARGLRGWGRRGAPSAAATAASALTSALRKALLGVPASTMGATSSGPHAEACRRRLRRFGRPASPSAATAATRGPRCRGGSAAGSSATARAQHARVARALGAGARFRFRAFLAEHGEGVVKS